MPAVDLIAAAVLDRTREEIEAIGRSSLEVVEHAAALEVGGGVFQQVLPDRLEERVAGGDPLQSRVLGQE